VFAEINVAERMAGTVTITKRKIVLFLVAGLAGSGILMQSAAAGEKRKIDDGTLTPLVDERVQAWQPTKDERRLDDIGWAKDIRDALRLARECDRPIFLFTYSGCADREHAMALQRC
jgi:hypothetical protein